MLGVGPGGCVSEDGILGSEILGGEIPEGGGGGGGGVIGLRKNVF